MAYPLLDALHEQAINAIDARENMVIELCRQQGATTLLRRILGTLQDGDLNIAVMSITRDHALEVVGHLPADNRVACYGPEIDEDGGLEPFDLVLMDNVYHMKDDVVETVTQSYNYLAITTPRPQKPHLLYLTHCVDARWRLEDGTIVNNRVPPWIDPKLYA